MSRPFPVFVFQDIEFIETEKDEEFKPGPSTYAFHLDRIKAEKINPCLEIPEMELGPIGREKSVQDQVIDDMIERKKFGLKKYGKEIMPGDNRDMLSETSEELMDALVYLKAESNVRAELKARIVELEAEKEQLQDKLLYAFNAERGLVSRRGA